MTETSVAVVSNPVKAHQSLTTRPAPITSDPRLTVPATRGIWSRDESSSSSDREVLGWTRPPCISVLVFISEWVEAEGGGGALSGGVRMTRRGDGSFSTE